MSRTESSNEARQCVLHITRVAERPSSAWLPRHERGLLVCFDFRKTVSDPAGQLEIGRTAALRSLIRQGPA